MAYPKMGLTMTHSALCPFNSNLVNFLSFFLNYILWSSCKAWASFCLEKKKERPHLAPGRAMSCNVFVNLMHPFFLLPQIPDSITAPFRPKLCEETVGHCYSLSPNKARERCEENVCVHFRFCEYDEVISIRLKLAHNHRKGKKFYWQLNWNYVNVKKIV